VARALALEAEIIEVQVADDFERAFWERGCLSADNKEYGTASALSRDRAKLRWIAADFTDLDPELAVIKLFERGLPA